MPEMIEIEDVRAIRQTPAALLCVVDGTERWIPQSLIGEDSEVWRDGDEGTLVVPEWFAIKEGLV